LREAAQRARWAKWKAAKGGGWPSGVGSQRAAGNDRDPSLRLRSGQAISSG